MLLLLEPVRLTRTNSLDLQSLVDGVSGEDVLLIVGDLNARVGSGNDGGDEWDAVLGRRGVGQMNEAGEVLLSCEEEI